MRKSDTLSKFHFEQFIEPLEFNRLIAMNASSIEERLKLHWNTNDLLFIAEYRRSENNQRFGYFTNISVNDRRIFYPITDGQVYERHVVIHLPHNENLTSGHFYAIRVKPVNKNTSNNPYLIELVEVFEIEGYESPREFIKKWFSRKGENPGDAATIASQLRLNELELYTQTERFIFELLQNADDMPVERKKVKVKMELLDDYFLFLHDGKFFDRNDVRAIADAAQSTKSRDKTKTGYKGIGFKSVFTDSTRVFIKSFDYSFKFDKLHPVYQDFWQLYKSYIDESSEAKQKEIKREYTAREAEFTQIERIPWQIKPIWVEKSDFPDKLKKSDFWSNQNVAIALEIGQATFEEKQYDQKISNLLSEPRFLLFLRNITSVSYKHGDHVSTLALERSDAQFNILLNNAPHSTYTKWEAEVDISNESFAEAGLRFQKRALQEGKYQFITEDGQQIKNIPEKLSILDRTTLTFSAQIQGNLIRRIPKEEAILFNYLPTSDKRFGFPFLVNGDFVTKTDREFILHENIWNQYLFFHIGYFHISWLNRLSRNQKYQSSYLNLLVTELKDDTHQSEGEINEAFNRGLKKAIANLPFIRTEAGQNEFCENIILDETGLAKALGSNLFYTLTGTLKKLPEPKIRVSILRYDFLGIERFKVDQLIYLLRKETSLRLFTEAIIAFSETQYVTFLQWLNTLCSENIDSVHPLLPSLPFLRFGNKVTSWSSIVKQDEYLLIDNRTDSFRKELTALGFILSDINCDSHPTLKLLIDANDTYLDTDSILYNKISVRCNLNPLSPEHKSNLYIFFIELNQKQVGEENYAKSLCLFADDSGTCRPLDKLLSRNIEGLPIWLTSYKINEAEFKILPPSASKYLVTTANLFSQLLCDYNILAECTKHLDIRHVSEWVAQILTWRNKEQPKTPDSGWNALPWLYTNDKMRFKSAAQLWTHEALTIYPAHSVLESVTGWITPHTACQALIKEFDLRLMQDKITVGIAHTDQVFSEKDTKLFIQFLNAAGEHSFFKKWQFLIADTGFQLSTLTKKTIFSADDTICSFIQMNHLGEVLIPFPNNLADQSVLANLGVITGDALLTLLAEKAAFIALAPVLTKRADTRLYTTYLQHLSMLSLSSSVTYTDSSPEVHALRIAHDIADRDKSPVFSSFLKKIVLDGQLISAIKDFGATVTVKNLVGREPYKFSTAELLPNNAHRIDRVLSAINAFIKCKLISQKFLRDEVFSSKELIADDAESEIFKSMPDFLSPQQLVFLQIHRLSKGESKPQFKIKSFYHYWHEKLDDKKAWEEIGDYLNLIYDKGLTISYLSFGLNKHVTDPAYCYARTETLPDFFIKWADTESKLLFLTELNQGANGSESEVVKLRKALLQADSEVVGVQTRTVDNVLLINTLKWLVDKEDDTLTTVSIDSIKLILKKITWPNDQTPIIPIIVSIDEKNKVYRLAEFNNEVIHTWSETWGAYEGVIVNLLKSKKIWVVGNDLPNELNKRIGKLASKDAVTKLANDILVGSDLLSEPCYETWVLSENYPIYIIQSNSIPWQVWYDDALVTYFEEGLNHFDESTKITYLTKGTAKSFPLYLPNNFPSDLRTTLFELKMKLFESREENLLLQTSFADSRTYNVGDEAIQSGRELSDAQQRAVYGEVVQRGVLSLEEDGYDFTNAIQAESGYFKNVMSPNNEGTIEVYFRSAKGGLLYLNPGLWLRLDEPNLLLVVLYADGKLRYVESKGALLRGRYNDYVLFRMTNNLQPEATDQVAEQMSDTNGHLLFITGSEMHRSLSQEFDLRKNNPPIDSASGNKFDL